MRAHSILFGRSPTTESSSPLVGRLHPDPQIARHAAFALFARVYLEAAGLMPSRLMGADGAAALSAIDQVLAANPHLLTFFAPPERRAALDSLEASAVRELVGWAAAQHVEREEPQIAYELGMLALGVELPGILVGALRDLDLRPETTVAELPDGSGYPTVFLATLHPHWPAAQRARLFVSGTDAEQLAAWAFVVLGQRLAPPAGRIVRVSPQMHGALQDSPYDVTLLYNPVSWLGSAAGAETAALVRSSKVVVL